MLVRLKATTSCYETLLKEFVDSQMRYKEKYYKEYSSPTNYKSYAL